MAAGTTYSLIGSYTYTADGPQYNALAFSNIPQTYTDLVLIVNSKDQIPVTSSVYQPLTFNNDGGNNYSETQMAVSSGSFASSRWSNQNILQFMQQPGNNSPAGYFSINEIQIMNYSSTNIYKTVLVRNNLNGTTNNQVRVIAGLWKGTAGITTVTVNGTWGYKTGSSISLYGIKAA
jgi:hypothetical protein